ncbi:hypothetical protein GGX14DRAFT_571438 [Mycena pura]|uniref:Uncharacterized protein n=1 Tax=Mycena pura TaxID=153505 RepID=A0AAD6YBU8_9AGAR|nr:hypothetical protein GGX14DRAFT_571438 [Mycena pura]
MEPALLDGLEGKLTHLLLTLAESAMSSDEARFLSKTRLLWDMTKSPEYAASEGALQALQEKAQALEMHPFNLKKWIEKLLEIETAVLTLYALAVSGRRGGIVMCPLIVHNVPLPSKGSVEVALCDIKESWCPFGQSRTTTIEQIRTATESTSNHTILDARSYNKSMGNIRNSVSYEDSRGRIQPGWWPPPMENPQYTWTLKRIISGLDDEFFRSKYANSLAAPAPGVGSIFISPEEREMMDARKLYRTTKYSSTA